MAKNKALKEANQDWLDDLRFLIEEAQKEQSIRRAASRDACYMVVQCSMYSIQMFLLQAFWAAFQTANGKKNSLGQNWEQASRIALRAIEGYKRVPRGKKKSP